MVSDLTGTYFDFKLLIVSVPTGCDYLKDLSGLRCKNMYDYSSAVYSTADKCDADKSGTPPTAPYPYLNAGQCDGNIGGIYKTCCSNTTPSFVISDSRSGVSSNSCVQVAPYSGAPYPPYDGICPTESHSVQCSGNGCGQPACGPTTICGNGICESGETAANCPADCGSTSTPTPTPTPTATPGPSCNCTYPQACTTANNEAGVQTCSGISSGLNCVYDSSGSCAPNCSTCVVNPPLPPPPPPPTGCSFSNCGPCPTGATNYNCTDPNKCRYVEGPSCAADYSWFRGPGCYQDNTPNACGCVGGNCGGGGQQRCIECKFDSQWNYQTIFMEGYTPIADDYCSADRHFQWQSYGPRANEDRSNYNNCLYTGGTQSSCVSRPADYPIDNCVCGDNTSEVILQTDPNPIAGMPFTITTSSFKPFDLDSNCWAYGQFYDDNGNQNRTYNPDNPPSSNCGTPESTQFPRDVYLIYATSANPQGFVSLGKAQTAFTTSQVNDGRTYPRRNWTWQATLPEGTYSLYTYVVDRGATGQFLGNPTQSWQCGQLGSPLVVRPNYSTWIQTQVGDVHSNSNIAASGGPLTASGQSCEAPPNICRATGLVSTALLSTTNFYTSSTGATATGFKTQFAPYKIPSYDDLKALYYDQSKASKVDITPGQGQKANQGTIRSNLNTHDLLYTSGDVEINGNLGGSNKTGIIFIKGNLLIDKDFTFGDNQSGLVFVVGGDVNIGKGVKQLDAVIISSGKICTAYDSNNNTCSQDQVLSDQLVVNGALIPLNADNPIKFKRKLADNSQPAEKIVQQPKYLVILKDLFSDTFQKWSEVP